jgi:multimeric flavodoxin WrbA
LNIAAITGSLWLYGNTDYLTDIAPDAAKKAGATTEKLFTQLSPLRRAFKLRLLKKETEK